MASPPQTPYELAKQRVQERRKFQQHLRTYLIMIGFLFLVNVFSSPGHWWIQWPILGWGLGLAFHAMRTYSSSDDSEAIEREYRKITDQALPTSAEPEMELKKLERLVGLPDEDEFV